MAVMKLKMRIKGVVREETWAAENAGSVAISSDLVPLTPTLPCKFLHLCLIWDKPLAQARNNLGFKNPIQFLILIVLIVSTWVRGMGGEETLNFQETEKNERQAAGNNNFLLLLAFWCGGVLFSIFTHVH